MHDSVPDEGNGKNPAESALRPASGAEMVQRGPAHLDIGECGMNKVIDLRSDTVTRPTPGMLYRDERGRSREMTSGAMTRPSTACRP